MQHTKTIDFGDINPSSSEEKPRLSNIDYQNRIPPRKIESMGRMNAFSCMMASPKAPKIIQFQPCIFAGTGGMDYGWAIS